MPEQTVETQIWSESTLFVTHQLVFRYSNSSQMHLFKLGEVHCMISVRIFRVNARGAVMDP